MLKVVSFDAAGTLIRPVDPVGVTYARFAARYGATALDASALEHEFRRAFTQRPPLAFSGLSDAERAGAEFRWWSELVEEVVTAAGGVARFDEFFAALYAHYAAGAAWIAYPEVHDTLDALQARGLRLAVLSNFDSRLPLILAELGIARYFEAVVYSSAAGAAKPDPAAFRALLARLSVGAAETLHVGDSRDADYAGARAAGLQARWLVRSRAPEPPAIASLRELRTLA
jgi:putative hydrolase of the HAD superfamily